jgi:hypothetical protein
MPMDEDSTQLRLAKQLISRLERLSADSYWSHQASGVRGALLRGIQRLSDGGAAPIEAKRMKRLIERGFYILEQAAHELERKV